MTDNDIYRYIMSLHNNPKTLVISKSLIFKPNKRAWLYSINGQEDLIITEDDINLHIEQLKFLK